MKNLIIVGAGGFGREIYSWILQHPDYNKKWRLKGFIDNIWFGSDLSDHPLRNYDIQIIDKIDDYQIETNDVFIMALGEPNTKETIVSKLKKQNAEFISYIHPSVVIGENVIIGEGTVICPNVTLTCDINIGDFVTINVSSGVGHDAIIGDFSTLSGHCEVTGYCTLGRGVFFGTHAIIVPSTTVEEYAVVGAGSVGMRKVKANTTVFGVPGRKIN